MENTLPTCVSLHNKLGLTFDPNLETGNLFCDSRLLFSKGVGSPFTGEVHIQHELVMFNLTDTRISPTLYSQKAQTVKGSYVW